MSVRLAIIFLALAVGFGLLRFAGAGWSGQWLLDVGFVGCTLGFLACMVTVLAKAAASSAKSNGQNGRKGA